MGGLISISRPNMLLLSLLIPFLTFTIKVTTAKEDTWLLLHWRVTWKALELPVLLSFSFSSVFLDGLTKVIWVISFYFCFRSVWSIWDLLTWFSICFQVTCFRDNRYGGYKRQHIESCSSTTKKHFISNTAMHMSTKLTKEVTYHERLLPIKSHDLLVMWSCDITWQTKTIISPLPLDLWLTNVTGW